MEQLEGFLRAKRQLTHRYQEAFRDVPGVKMFVERSGTQANYWLQTLLLDSTLASQRDNILEVSNNAGQMTRPVWELLNTLPMYKACEAMELTVAEELARRIINLPSSPQLLASIQ